MKTILAIVAALAVSIALPVSADEDDSLLEKGVKLKVYQESDDDSTLKKATKLKVLKEPSE